ncbi:MAG TPA: rRNA maturation RNase YbeY [Phycisphaerales bacterium]|nr:rRNA maturation RNase YbeY [Phycisphaerales bacterium]
MLLAGHPAVVGHEVRVRLVRDDQMAAAHARHLSMDSTTDVLTFDLRDGDDDARADRPLDTDILVCVDEARRQAERRNVPVEREALLYVLHGVLHCLGEDDHDDDAYRRMHEREDQVLRALGVGETFALPEQSRPGPSHSRSALPEHRGGAC